jgi:hypothetical protein
VIESKLVGFKVREKGGEREKEELRLQILLGGKRLLRKRRGKKSLEG